MVSVTIGTTSVEQLLGAQASRASGDELGEASVTLRDTSTNRSFQAGDSVVIDWGNGYQWRGDVTGRPSNSAGQLVYTAKGKFLQFKHAQAYRVFYNTKSSDAVKALVTEETEQLPETLIHTGDDPSNWTSQAPVAEVYGGSRATLYEFGTDLLFLGAREGHSTELQTTYDSVPSDAEEDGIFELKTRLITSDLSNNWSLIVELQTNGGTSYRWEPDTQTGAHTYELAAEEAEEDDSGLSNGELRYRLVPSGTTTDPFGVFIDHALTIPFRTSSRSGAPSTDIEATDRTIKRRVDASAGRAIDNIAIEDDADYFLDDSKDEFVYRPGKITNRESLSITDSGSEPIVGVDVDRDFEGIRNEVVVQGADGVEVIERDQSSIDYYGPVPRPEPIVDPSLETESEARDRADGFLDENAWNDATPTFSIRDLDYAQLQPGKEIEVVWSDENLDGYYAIDSVRINANGVVAVSIDASTADS